MHKKLSMLLALTAFFLATSSLCMASGPDLSTPEAAAKSLIQAFQTDDEAVMEPIIVKKEDMALLMELASKKQREEYDRNMANISDLLEEMITMAAEKDQDKMRELANKYEVPMNVMRIAALQTRLAAKASGLDWNTAKVVSIESEENNEEKWEVNDVTVYLTQEENKFVFRTSVIKTPRGWLPGNMYLTKLMAE